MTDYSVQRRRNTRDEVYLCRSWCLFLFQSPELGFAQHYDDVACMAGRVAVLARAKFVLSSLSEHVIIITSLEIIPSS
jgi:hypothetical protein